MPQAVYLAVPLVSNKDYLVWLQHSVAGTWSFVCCFS